jgi:hypothetical protein
MIAILGSRHDPEAAALAKTWSATLIDADDLCRSGWSFDVAAPGAGTFVAAGTATPTTRLQAVVVRRPAVLATELGAIATEDRAYAASEIQAFLLSWLDALPCRVVNRPSARCLCGPAWSPLHWAVAARRVGLEWGEPTASAGPPDGAIQRADVRDVIACEDRCFGHRSATEREAIGRLAAIAGVSLLGVRFVEERACSASAMPRLDDPEIRDALFDCLTARSRP